MFDNHINALSGPDFLDAVADAEEANGLEINASVYRDRANQWRREQQAREEAEAALDRITRERARVTPRATAHAITPTDRRA